MHRSTLLGIVGYLLIGCILSVKSSLWWFKKPKRSKASKACGKKILWFMAVGSLREDVDRMYYKHVAAAFNSAQIFAPTLVPYLIHSGRTDDLPLSLRSIPGVNFLSHNLTFMDDLKSTASPAHLRLYGAYYRLDIPFIMDKLRPTLDAHTVDVEYVLYTDTDVLFFKDFTECSLPKPSVLYIGPEFERGKADNSGVMYVNVSAMAHHMPAVKKLAISRKWEFTAWDQGLLLEYYRDGGLSSLLPDIYNWKGYWGSNKDVVIAHFHGPKPGQCLDCFLEFRHNRHVCGSGCAPLDGVFALAPDDGDFYEKMMISYKNFTRRP